MTNNWMGGLLDNGSCAEPSTNVHNRHQNSPLFFPPFGHISPVPWNVPVTASTQSSYSELVYVDP